MVTCGKCGAENADGAEVCRMCGDRLVIGRRHCVSCGRSIDWVANVCPYCGHDFRAAPAGPVAKTVSTGLKVGLYIVSVLVPIAGIVLGLVYMGRDSPEEKRIGTICLALGIVCIVVMPVVATAAVYFWVLRCGGTTASFPEAVLTRGEADGGYSFTFSQVTANVPWSELTVEMMDFPCVISWHLSSSDLTGASPTTKVYASKSLGATMMTLSVTDIAGNGRVNDGDYLTIAMSPAPLSSSYYIVAVIHEPTNGLMCALDFTATSPLTPSASLWRDASEGEYRFTFSLVTADVPWSDLTIEVSDGSDSVSWRPASSDLTGSSPTTMAYESRSLGTTAMALSITDVAGNGCLNDGDCLIITIVSTPPMGEYCTIAVIYEPTGEWMSMSLFMA